MFFANFLSETISPGIRSLKIEKRKTECFDFDWYCFDVGQSDCDIQISRVLLAHFFVVLKLVSSAPEHCLVIHCEAHFTISSIGIQ